MNLTNVFSRIFQLLVLSLSLTTALGQNVKLEKACFSTKWEDYGPRLVAGKLYCLSASFDGDSTMLDPYTLQPYSDLYVVNGCKLEHATFPTHTFGERTSMSSNFYDGPLTGNDKVLFFTNNHSLDQNTRLGVFYAFKKDNKWQDAEVFPFNSENYNVSHPFYDEKNKKIYFISDKGRVGQNQDLYVCSFDGTKFGTPSKIDAACSAQNEVAPFVYKDTLYFSSNGFGSKGGYDLFKYVDGKVVSMGPAYNSPFDDLAIMFDSDTSGYFASDRYSSGKDDDIIRFIIVKDRVKPVIDTVITDLPIIATVTKEEALSQLVAAKNAVDSLRASAIKAGVSSDVFSFLDLSLEQFKQNFPTSFEGKNIEEINTKIAELKAILALVNQQMDIVSAQNTNTSVAQTPKEEINVDVINSIIDQTKIENIHFKFDSYEITPEYQTYLRGLAMLFKANPEWQVGLSGHTDGVGNAAYNKELSRNRAKSTKSFLERNGMSPERVTFDFFGMTMPIAPNNTPEGRYLNRRVEIKVSINGKTIIEGTN